MGVDPLNATSIAANTAAFLLARGAHAFIGFGQWGLVWPNNATQAPLPFALFGAEYGVPHEPHCRRVAPSSARFERRWSAGLVSLDCASFAARLPHL